MVGVRLVAVLLPALLFGVVNGDCGPGIPGILDEGRCCAAECGECGGDGCSERPGGEFSCCFTPIETAGVSCYDTGAGPCMMVESSEPTCSNGFPGFEAAGVCCPLECGACGGFGCSDLGGGPSAGLGKPFCCTATIISEGEVCSDTVSAPCIIGSLPMEPSPSPSTSPVQPTPSPVSPPTVEPTPSPVSPPTAVTPSPSSPSPSPSPSPPPVTPSSNPSPTPIMTIPTSCELSAPEFWFAGDAGIGGRMYAEGEGCFTMTDLYGFQEMGSDGRSMGPVYVLDDDDEVDLYPDSFTGKWLLTSEMYITGGGTFYCRGTDIGGDCDELRIESTGPDAYHEVRGHGGNLYFENTVVTSWDTPNKKTQEEHEGGRSFLNCISEKQIGTTCAKNDMGECRMDIISSEMGYMGFFDAESYGITWKVRGFCTDLSNPQVFDDVNVYGDIKDSDIHHMYYGHYSYGHQGGVWTNNKMHDNFVYGFDPHDDSDYLTIAGNEVYNNANHCIIASKRCDHLKIYDNYVHDGDNVGIFLHRSGNDCEIYGNVITNMVDAGIVLMESSNNDIHDNVVDGARYGIRLVTGANNNEVYDNEFNDISDAGIYTYHGSDTPWIGDGRTYDNEFYDNKITDTAVGVKLTECDGNIIRDNEFTGTEYIEFEDAQDTVWSDNTLPSEACLENKDDSSPTSTFENSSGLPDEC